MACKNVESMGYRERRIGARDGLSLYVRDYGDPLSEGAPLLCLAGLTRNSKDFHTLASRVAVDRRVLSLDYRGRGESPHDPDWRKYRPEVILDDIFQVLTACDAHPVVVCGVSYGGLMAMALGALAPSMLAGVILNDVGPELDPEGSRRIMAYIERDRPQPDWPAGRGESPHDPDWRKYRPEVILDDIFQVLTACDAHPVVVCGVSYGGLMAMALGALAPSMLAGVILNDVGPELDPEGSRRIMAYIERDRPQPDWPAAIAEMKRTLPTLALGNDDAWRRFTEATYRQGTDGQLHFDWDVSLAKVLRQPEDTPDLWPLYGTLRNVPVLALRGSLSDVLSEQTFARMATVKPDLLQLTVPDVGHVPSFEHTLVERAIDDFLAQFVA